MIKKSTVWAALAGVLVGIPLSYYFQSPFNQTTFNSVVDYVTHLGRVLDNKPMKDVLKLIVIATGAASVILVGIIDFFRK